MGKRRNSRLAVGDKVVVMFLGIPYNGVVTVVREKDLYKVTTLGGTVLPSCRWEDKSPKDKKGKIISPWYIIKTGHENSTLE
jgi:hypothetical protein